MSYDTYPRSVIWMLAERYSAGQCAVCSQSLHDGEDVVASRDEPSRGISHATCAERSRDLPSRRSRRPVRSRSR